MESITESYNRYLRYHLAKDDATATTYEKYMALSYAVRGRTVDKWIETQRLYHANNVRRVHYLSMEYIFGRSLRQNIVNLGLEEEACHAAGELGFSLEELFDAEDDFELGNGGKGRLAACFQEAMASRRIPAIGYGLRYDYALFRQEIVDGRQTERPYDWAHKGHPWEIVRPQYACTVPFGGSVRQTSDGSLVWECADEAVAVPYDMPVAGFQNDTVNTLRLWSARASEQFLSDYVNHNDYARACDEKSRSGRITRLLIPDEDIRRATELRIKQQYFFVSASLQDTIRRFKLHNSDITRLADKVVVHINGSRSAIAIAELMRLLIDIEKLPWDQAWDITRQCFAYTSHAVTGDNLENWPVYLLEQVLPRHIRIIYDINQRHLDTVPVTGDTSVLRDISIVEEGEVKRVRMASLALLGAATVNGVSALQTQRLKSRIFGPVTNYCGARFVNTTNGVAHRRWLMCANRSLAEVISGAIGNGWLRDAAELEKLRGLTGDGEFLSRYGMARDAAKRCLADALVRKLGVHIDPTACIDIQATRVHPYRRQTLHVLGILWRYRRIRNGGDPGVNRVHVFAGRAAPSDHLAKQVIHLIHAVADVINADPLAHGRLKVVFIPNWGVTWGEYLIPAADITEAIATPNLEACGSSGLKAVFNGAVAVASKAGVNLELAERAGLENTLLFGHTGDDLDALLDYHPNLQAEEHADLRAIVNYLEEQILPARPGGDALYPLVDSLKATDPQFVLLDFADYICQQCRADEIYRDRQRWLAMSLASMAGAGYFSSDRSVEEYARDIWKLI